jgi:hypothetical protein
MFFWVFPRRHIVVVVGINGYKFPCFPSHLTVYIQPWKMELTQGSEKSANYNYNMTPGKYPKEHIQHDTVYL